MLDFLKFFIYFLIPFPLLVAIWFVRCNKFSIHRLVCRLGWPCPQFIAFLITLFAGFYTLAIGALGLVTFQTLMASSIANLSNNLMLFIGWCMIIFLNAILLKIIACGDNGGDDRERHDRRGRDGGGVVSFLLYAIANWLVCGMYVMQLAMMIPGLEKIMIGIMAWNTWIIFFAAYFVWLCCCCGNNW